MRCLQTYVLISSRLDRARIFYNHIWQSGQLSYTARLSLLTEENYQRIIDHPKYNPRLIEYITGLASRRLDDADNNDYLDFAIATLDDPKKIWERAFERQLDDDCKDVLIALASMPTQTTLGDLKTAFEHTARAHDRRPSRNAYKDAMRILDNSFTRSHEEVNQIFIAVNDPSVEDFVAAWLETNHSEALASIRGVAFFEQLIWLYDKIVPSGNDGWAVQLQTEFADAVTRCWNTVNPGWGKVYFGNNPVPHLIRKRAEVMDRLIFVSRLLSSTFACEERLGQWFDDQVNEVIARWSSKAHVNPATPVSLVEALVKLDRLPMGAAEAALTALRDCASYSYEWPQIHRLLDIVPKTFTSTVRFELLTEFESWLHAQFTNDLYAVDGADVLWEIRSVAQDFGVKIDEKLFHRAHKELTALESDRAYEEHTAQESESAEPARDDEPKFVEQGMILANEKAAIDHLFARLAET